MRSEEAQHSDSVLDKNCLIVYEGKFDSADGPVDVTKEQLERLAKNHNAKHEARLSSHGGEIGGTIPDSPPVQLDHSASARDTVGRVVGPLTLGEHEGKTALYGKVRILGKENVECVKDGRWRNLSIGADFEAGELNEFTITPFPAAAKASLLKAGVRLSEGKFHVVFVDRPHAQDRSFGSIEAATAYAKSTGWWCEVWDDNYDNCLKSIRPTKLSGGTMHPEHEKMKKHLMEHDKLSEKDAEEKLSKMTDDEKKELSSKLAAPGDPREPKENTPPPPKDKAELTAARTAFKKLTKSFASTAKSASLQSRKLEISTKLSKLRSEAKITPAELKGIDLDKIASLPKDAVDVMFDTFSKRQPVVLVGTYGRHDAEAITTLAAKSADKQMLKEMEESMRFSKGVVKKLAAGEYLPTSMDKPMQMMDGNGGTTEHKDPTSMDVHEQLCHLKHLMESGRHEEGMKHLEACIAHHASKLGQGTAAHEGLPEESMKHLSALAENCVQLQNQFEELSRLVSPILGEESDE